MYIYIIKAHLKWTQKCSSISAVRSRWTIVDRSCDNDMDLYNLWDKCSLGVHKFLINLWLWQLSHSHLPLINLWFVRISYFPFVSYSFHSSSKQTLPPRTVTPSVISRLCMSVSSLRLPSPPSTRSTFHSQSVWSMRILDLDAPSADLRVSLFFFPSLASDENKTVVRIVVSI